MKKNIVTIIALSFILVGGFAVKGLALQTKGDSLGISVYRTFVPVKETNTTTSLSGVALSYQYAYNIKNFFMAPELYYLFNFNQKYGPNNTKLKDELGLRVNLGYDFKTIFSIFIDGGYAWINTTKSKFGNKGAIYGGGFIIKASELISIRLAYEVSHYRSDIYQSAIGAIYFNF